MNYGKKEIENKLKAANSKSKKYTTKVILTFFKTFLVLCIFTCIAGASVGFGVFRGIIDSAPDVDTLNITPEGFATTVFDSKGNVTDTLVMAGSNREEATYEELPEDLLNAFIAIEDTRFWTNNGIDIRSIARAVKGVLTNNSSAGGGSTITQQLIKNNVFNGGMETSMGAKIERKIQEQYLAVQLSKTMDKKLIITNYLNTINLGNNTLGVKVAARRYFNKEVSDLTLSECAVIAGITKNPSRYNPITGKEDNAERRKIILQYMCDQGLIEKAEQEQALADDVYSRIQNVDLANKETSNIYSYYTDELVEQVMDALKNRLGYSDTQAHNLLFGGGLEIHTAQDPDIQAIVDAEVNNPENYSAARYSVEYRLSVNKADGTTKNYSEEDIKAYHKNELKDKYDGLYNSEEEVQADIDRFKTYILQEGDTVIGERSSNILEPQASFVIIDQATGQVKALSGGRGEKRASLTLNRASNTKRQPGSTFKVITSFAPALDACGSTLGSVYYDAPFTVGNKTFSNWYSSKGHLGYSNIREGIIYSMNIVAVRCMMETVTPQLGVEYARKFGITSLTSTDLNAATALGGITDGVSNLEMTAAYASIANGGVYTKPVFFTKILDHNGKVLISNDPEAHRVIKDSTAFLLTDSMADSMEASKKYGSSVGSTSAAASIPGMSNAGKSGTTTSNNDIWFVGYTPYYTAGIWAGCDSNQKLTAQNGGTSFHKKIWQKIMTQIHTGMSDPGFTAPDSVETAQICRKSGKLALSGVCTEDPRGNPVYTEYFARGTAPTEFCDKHVRVTVCAESGMLPTLYCPVKTSKTFMSIPAGEGTTSDSAYAIPGYCTIHGDASTILPPSSTEGSGNDSYVGPHAPTTAPSSQAPGSQAQSSQAPTASPVPVRPYNPFPWN